jgi:spore germination cell wall hydrolase CwlJ-like protein
MAVMDLTRYLGEARRGLAAVPVVMAVMGLAMTASSTPRPQSDRTAEAVAMITRGDLSDQGLRALTARFDPAMLAEAMRQDPANISPALYGLTPGWESLSLAGKPTLDLDGRAGLEAQRINASLPAEFGALKPARPFVLNTSTPAERARALRCLTQAVYYEAALESTRGQEGVAQVVLNRVRDPNFPTTVCGVVFQGAERTTGCQFSFTCDGSLANAPAPWAWRRAQSVAERALSGYVAAEVGTATHYHADYVYPWWAPSLSKIRQIGAHIFYRWRGLAGDSSAFTQAHNGREPVIDEARFSQPRIMMASTVTTDPDAIAAATGGAVRTVEINGATRVVGVVSLGGRRMGTADEIAAINERLAQFEATAAPAPRPAAPEGVTVMEVEEVGRPAG